MHELLYQFASNLRAAWRYRWFAIAGAWLIAIAGWAAVHRIPDRYEATARVWVDSQSVLKHLMAGITAQPNVQQLVGMLSRTLISRPNLEKVIRMANMESEIKGPLDRELLITRLTKEVSVQSAGGENFFTIGYTSTDPKKAQWVVQALLTIFEDGAHASRRMDSEGAQRFIEDEIKNYKEKLDAAENVVVEFKRRQALAAGVRGDHATQLASVQSALDEAKMELKIAEVGWDAINRRTADQADIPDLVGDTHAPSEVDVRIKALEQKRDGLRVNFTDQHPDIVSITRTIAQLEEEKRTQATQRRLPPNATPASEAPPQQLNLSVAAAEANVAAAKLRVAEYTKRYDELRAAAAAAPEADAEFARLNRDYEWAKSAYASMVSRRETARISDEMESRANVTNFRVVDPPQVSARPTSPNRTQLNLMVLIVAIAGGAGLAYLLGQLRPTIGDERRLREVTGAQVLGTVVMDWTKAEKERRMRGLIAFFASFASLVSALAAINFALALMASRT
jgi:polysaccharide chain length determinant protein (PEP-CTERM system associated)